MDRHIISVRFALYEANDRLRREQRSNIQRNRQITERKRRR